MGQLIATIHLIKDILLRGGIYGLCIFILLAPIGLILDLIMPGPGYPAVQFMVGLSSFAGLAFGVGLAWYLNYLDRQLKMPDLEPGEQIKFSQYGYIITSEKYDPGRIMITNRRLLLLPTHFNSGPRIPEYEAWLSDLQPIYDRQFSNNLAGGFWLLKFQNKLVFSIKGNSVAYMPNLGDALPTLKLFTQNTK
jgi:hypothetical protein